MYMIVYSQLVSSMCLCSSSYAVNWPCTRNSLCSISLIKDWGMLCKEGHLMWGGANFSYIDKEVWRKTNEVNITNKELIRLIIELFFNYRFCMINIEERVKALKVPTQISFCKKFDVNTHKNSVGILRVNESL